MNDRIVALATTALLLLGSAAAFGETVTLREAVGRALGGHHLVQAAALEQGAAEEEVAIGRSRYLPRVYLESGALLSNRPSTVFMMKLDEGKIDPSRDFSGERLNHPGSSGDFRSALVLEQPLLDFGVSTGVELARKEAEVASLSLEARREQVAFRVFLAYLEVRKAKAYQEIAEQAVADAQEHGRLAEVRERDGVGLKSDRLRAATALAEARQREITAGNDLLLARMRLNLAVGGPEGGVLDIGAPPLLELPPAAPGELVALAQRSRPDLGIAGKELERGELSVRQARDAYLPTIYGRADYQLNDGDRPLGWENDSWSVGVNLRWELFDGYRRSHGKQKAQLAREAAAALLENRRREVALQVTESILRREEEGLKLESARAALLAAEEAKRLITLRFRNGLSSMVELMDAESALNGSKANLVEAENGLLRANGELCYRAGVFVKEVMK